MEKVNRRLVHYTTKLVLRRVGRTKPVTTAAAGPGDPVRSASRFAARPFPEFATWRCGHRLTAIGR
ncbi:MAG: hypothetical protein ACI4Q3_02780, partial [Kiritimatiellia bacterium]